MQSFFSSFVFILFLLQRCSSYELLQQSLRSSSNEFQSLQASTPAPAPASTGSTDPSEVAVLKAVQATAWSSYVSFDPCQTTTTWPGISCTIVTGTPTAYHVSSIQLSGDTPEALAALLSLASQLKYLERLRVVRTTSSSPSSPSATIPESFGELELLQELDLGDNGVYLNGVVPSNLTSLKRVVLAGNTLHGPFPDSICRISSLEFLDLSRNELQGEVPDCLQSLTSLKHLDLSSNRLGQRVPELGLISGLTYLSLENNQLRGEVPLSLFALTSLKALKCGRNQLQGRLPDELGQLKSLEVLDFSFNSGLTGGIPSSIGNLSELVELRLFSTGLRGSIPAEVGSLRNVTKVLLHSNRLSGSIPNSLSQLSKLQLLQLQGNMLSGSIPGSVLGNLSSLQGLYLQLNRFTGSFPVEATRLQSLSVLNLGFNQLEGELPEELGQLTNLEWLLLGGNRFSGQIPSSIGKLPRLHLLDLSSNLFNGSVPSTILDTHSLEENLELNHLNSGTGTTVRDLCFQASCLSYSGGVSDSFAINVGGSEQNSSFDQQLSFQADNVTASVGFLLERPTCSAASASWAVAITGSAGSSRIVSTSSPVNVSQALGVDLQFVAANRELYMSARVGGDSIAYYGRCMKAGSYVVQLHFVELEPSFVQSPGRRVFDVLVQDRVVYSRLDVLELTGVPFVPLVQEYPAQVDDSSTSTLKIELRGTGSWNTSDSYNGPTISAIRVYANATMSGSGSGSGHQTWAILGGSVGVLLVVCTGLLVALVCWLRRAEKRARAAGEVGRENHGDEEAYDFHHSLSLNSHLGSLTSFEYSELLDATKNFSSDNLVGQGAHGKVFKGVFPDGKVVAIKQLVHRTPTCKKWFHHELQVISSVRHRNLVPLIGCCIDRGFPLLVCEFMPNGSLQNALFSKGKSGLVLTWELRYQIALDVARGLQYLHEDCSRVKIIHRDVKPANILLDSDMRAHISDFGLAKLMDHHEDSEVFVSSVMGTRGYLAPEYVLNGQLSEKVDVYSYGIVLLELVSGRRGMQSSMNVHSLEPVSIDEWAWEGLSSNNVQAIADARLGNSYAVDEMLKLVQVAMWCTQGLPDWRPGMGQVVQMLSDQVGIPELPSERFSWDDFKDVVVSETFTGSTIWESINPSNMSGYETANPATLPDPSEEAIKSFGVRAPPPSEAKTERVFLDKETYEVKRQFQGGNQTGSSTPKLLHIPSKF